MAKPVFFTADQDTWGIKITFEGPDSQLFDLIVDLIHTNECVNTFIQQMSERKILQDLPQITMSNEYLRRVGLYIRTVFCYHKGFTEPVYRDDQITLSCFGINEKQLCDTDVQLTFLGDNNIILQSPHCFKNLKINDLCNILDEMKRFPSHPLVQRMRNASDHQIKQFVDWVPGHAPWLKNDDLYGDIQKALVTDNWMDREEILDTFAQFQEDNKIN